MPSHLGGMSLSIHIPSLFFNVYTALCVLLFDLFIKDGCLITTLGNCHPLISEFRAPVISCEVEEHSHAQD